MRFLKSLVMLFVGLIALLVVVGIISSGNNKPSTDSSGSTPIKDASAQSCKDDYKACKDNEDLANNYSRMPDAEASCKIATNDHVQYGTPDWPWIAFGTFYNLTTGPKHGFIDLFEKNVKIQNQFGAMMHSEVHCRYDLAAQKAIMIAINDEEPIVLDDDLWAKSENELAQDAQSSNDAPTSGASTPATSQDSPAPSPQPTAPEAAAGNPGHSEPADMWLGNLDMNARSCPGMTCTPIAVIPKNSKVIADLSAVQNVTEASGAQTPWVKITYSGPTCDPATLDPKIGCIAPHDTGLMITGWMNYRRLSPAPIAQ